MGLLAVAVALPIALLLLGLALGLALGRWLLPWLLARLRRGPPAPPAPAAEAGAAAAKASSSPRLLSVHVVAGAAPQPLPGGAAPGLPPRLGSSRSPSPPHRPPPPVLALPSGAGSGDSPQPSPAATPLGQRRGRSSTELGRLMRAGTSVLSQVMEDLDTRSALMRLMSDGVTMLPSPQAGSQLFSPRSLAAPGEAAIEDLDPWRVGRSFPGPAKDVEVHIDEIDLLECIGRGGYGAVYKASWRQAPVAVKYIVCRTDDHDSLGRAIREVVLSKKMSHPNVVQCFSWTVLTEPERQQSAGPRGSPGAAPAAAAAGTGGGSTATRRSLDSTFLALQEGEQQHQQQQSLRRITELPGHEEEQQEAGTAASSLPPSPFAEVPADAPFPSEGAEVPQPLPPLGLGSAADAASLPLRISSKQSTTESASGKSRPGAAGSGSPEEADPESSSPVIPAVRPADLPALAAAATSNGNSGTVLLAPPAEQQQPQQRLPALEIQRALAGDVHDDAETPSAAGQGGSGGFEDALLAQFQALASEMFLSRISPTLPSTLSHQATGSSSFSDIGHGFMLGDSSRGETQQTAPNSEWASRQGSPGSSPAVTPTGAAGDGGSSNPFRRSRLSRAASYAAHEGAAADGTADDNEAPQLPACELAAAGSAAGQEQQKEAVAAEWAARDGQQLQQPAEAAAAAGPGSEREAQLQPEATFLSRSEPEAAPLPAVSAELEHQRHGTATSSGDATPALLLQRSSAPPGGSSSSLGEATRAAAGGMRGSASVLSLTAWQQRSGGRDTGGGSRPQSVSPPSSGDGGGGVPDWLAAAPRGGGFQQWRAEGQAVQGAGGSACSAVPRIPSRLGPRLGLDLQHQQPATAAAPSGEASLAGALPPGSPSAGRALGSQLRLGSLSNLGALQGAGEEGTLRTPRSSPGAGQVGVCSRESSRSAARRQRRVDEVIDGELQIESRTDSFNSEEGFGSPVRNRCGGVKSVFELEGLHLTSQEALMVVVMEFCDLGALRKALKRRAFVPHGKWTFQTTYRALLRTAQEIAKGMEYIHDFDIVHGDLKPGNVLLKTHKVDRRGYIAKVSDFGLSRPLSSGETHVTLGSALGTLTYTAPETLATNIAKKPSDVYAFGIMLWEMFYCKDVYPDLLDGQICVGVCDGTLRPEFWEDAPAPYRRLAERCWHHDPNQRPQFKEIVRELVQIEVDFRNLIHRQNSKASLGGSGPSSLANSRPGSPDVVLRSKSRAGAEGDLLSRALMA